ncbi:MAG TPA: T9SS type A sorting domain-containing protein [Ignavibacteriaceae bacterium]|nr:T9SS type A sorting domain-containing protein [Ignavibacteriaceae bacterium]
MKNLRVFLLVLFFTANLFSQNWNNIVNTGLNTSQAVGVNILANQSGINVLYTTSGSGQIYYVLMSSSGTIIKQVLIDSEVYVSLLVGDNDNLFAVYVKNGSLKVVRSTNLFTSWTDISPTGASNVPVTLPPSNRFQQSGIESGTYQMFDAAYKDGKLHIAWTETINGLNEAYYSQYSLIDLSWIYNREEITSDYIGEKGGRPRIAILPTQLIFSYNWLNNYSLGTVRTRYRTIDGPNWSSSVTSFTGNSAGEKISSDNTYIHLFYYQWLQPGGNIPLYHKKILIGNSNWGTATLLANHIDDWNGVKCSKTVNGIFQMSYITFQYSTPGSAHLIYRSFSNNTWSAPFTVSNTLGYSEFFGFSTASNDLYFSWFNHPGNVSDLYYRQYDAAPLAPQNLTVSKSTANHPLLSWTKNNEADLDYYKIYKYTYSEQGWIPYGTSNTNSFEDLNETYLTGGSYANERWVYYKITALDKVPNPYESPYSNQVGAKVKGAGLEKSNSGTTLTEYSLDQNYPNPFNPSTKISYSIKEEGLVTLKVYDLLGKEIATLVNENKPAGNYDAEFNASQLPSGMYIYKLQSGSFTDVKKMLMTK